MTCVYPFATVWAFHFSKLLFSFYFIAYTHFDPTIFFSSGLSTMSNTFCSLSISNSFTIGSHQRSGCFIALLYNFGIQVSTSTTFTFGLLRYSRESFSWADGFGSLWVHLVANGNSFTCLVCMLFWSSDVGCKKVVSLCNSVLGSSLGAMPWSRVVGSVVALGMCSNVEKVNGSIYSYILVLLEVKI